MVALAPAAHLLLELSHSLVNLAFLSFIFAFEQKSAPHKYTQIWALRIPASTTLRLRSVCALS